MRRLRGKMLGDWQGFVVRYLQMAVGAIIGAISVVIFMAPFDIAPGGLTGVAVILNELFNTPIGLMLLILNIPIQYLGYRMLPGGWNVIIQTAFVLVIYTVSLDILTPMIDVNSLSDDRLLNALFGGIVGGIGGGLVYRVGGSFGGTSTIALIIQRKYGTPMSTTFLYTDLVIIFGAGWVFGLEPALYAVVALFVGGLATDYVMEGPSVIRTVFIVTDKPLEVSNALIHGLNRSVTSWGAEGMYTHQSRTMLYMTVGRSQVWDVRDIVSDIDPKAFVVVGVGHTAYGAGFRRMKNGNGNHRQQVQPAQEQDLQTSQPTVSDFQPQQEVSPPV